MYGEGEVVTLHFVPVILWVNLSCSPFQRASDPADRQLKIPVPSLPGQGVTGSQAGDAPTLNEERGEPEMW